MNSQALHEADDSLCETLVRWFLQNQSVQLPPLPSMTLQPLCYL